MSFACAQCFSDQRLQDWIRRSGQPGACSWCRSIKARVVSLEDLGPLFRPLAEVYDPWDEWQSFDNTDYISTLLQDDWQIFSDRIACAADHRMQRMAVAILEAGIHPKELCDYPPYRELFVRKELLRMSIADMFYARLTPLDSPAETAPISDDDLPPDHVDMALGELGTTYSCNRVFYRARVYPADRRQPFAPPELSAPPAESAPAGRGNRQGEPVLYLATDEATAAAEKRARSGQFIGIACVRLQRPQRVLDLVNLPYLKSPFFEEHLRWKGEALELLDTLGEELSKPVTEEDVVEQYEVSQEACDSIRTAGYDGVAYPSGLGPGHNVFLFDPGAGRVTKRRIVRLSDDGSLRRVRAPGEE